MYNLQEEINKAKHYLQLPPGEIIINASIILPEHFVLEGRNTQINVHCNGYAFRVEGKAGYASRLNEDLPPLSSDMPPRLRLKVENASGFKLGDHILILQEKSLPFKVEHNIIQAIEGNELHLQFPLLQSFSKKDEASIRAYLPKERVSIKNLCLKSAKNYDSYGIFASYTADLQIENVRFENLTRKAIYIEKSYFPKVRKNRLIDNGSLGKGDYGIGTSFCAGSIVSDNHLLRSGALYIKGGFQASYCGNISDSTGETRGDSLSIISSSYSRFSENILSRSNCYGIWMLNHSNHNTLSHNVISSGITAGIFVSNRSCFNRIDQNILTFNNGNGLFLDINADNNILENNQVIQNNSRGILVQSINNLITKNISKQNKLEDLRITIQDQNQASDNQVDDKADFDGSLSISLQEPVAPMEVEENSQNCFFESESGKENSKEFSMLSFSKLCKMPHLGSKSDVDNAKGNSGLGLSQLYKSSDSNEENKDKASSDNYEVENEFEVQRSFGFLNFFRPETEQQLPKLDSFQRKSSAEF